MIFGLTYDIRKDYIAMGFSSEETAEFDKEETVDAIAAAIEKCGHTTVRIGNLNALIAFLAAGKRVDIVFNIAEGLHGIGREAQVPALLDAFKIPYVFSDTVVLGLTLHKGFTKHIIRDCGIPTAKFYTVNSKADIGKISLAFPLFAKPAAEGTGKGITALSKIEDATSLEKVCVELLEKFKQPVLVEEYLPGREFTVGVVGSGVNARVVGGMEILLKESAESAAYSYQNKQDYLDHCEYIPMTGDIGKHCSNVALDAWRALDCRDGGRVDIRCDANGLPNFIEVNPLAGLNPVDSDLPILSRMQGVEYDALIKMIIESALERYEF